MIKTRKDNIVKATLSQAIVGDIEFRLVNPFPKQKKAKKLTMLLNGQRVKLDGRQIGVLKKLLNTIK